MQYFSSALSTILPLRQSGHWGLSIHFFALILTYLRKAVRIFSFARFLIMASHFLLKMICEPVHLQWNGYFALCNESAVNEYSRDD
jgi:hypothetical protein